MTENRSKQLLDVVLRAADDKLAQEIVALEVGHLTPVADYFVITHGKNEKQVQAIVDAIEEEVHKEGFEVKSIEGKDNARWILMDLNDVKDKILSGEDVIVRISGYCVNTKYLTPEQKAELTQRVFHEILSMDDALA